MLGVRKNKPISRWARISRRWTSGTDELSRFGSVNCKTKASNVSIGRIWKSQGTVSSAGMRGLGATKYRYSTGFTRSSATTLWTGRTWDDAAAFERLVPPQVKHQIGG